MKSLFTPVKPGVPIITTSSEPATYASLHPGSLYTGKGGVGQTVAAVRAITVAHKGPPGD